MTESATYPLFSNPEVDPDISWILKLVDQDSEVEASSSSSGSPERKEGASRSSGYSSGRVSAARQRQEYMSFSGSSFGFDAEGPIYPWAESPISVSNGSPPTEGSTPDTFRVFKTRNIQPSNEEATFYLQAMTPSCFDAPPWNFKASVTHSSGFVQPATLVRMESLPGYRCNFYPTVAGRYSASITPDGMYCLPGSNGAAIHGCPLDLLISRNYTLESQSPLVENLRIGDSGSKFWGITTDKFSDTLFVTDRDTHEVIALHPAAGGNTLYRYGRQAAPDIKNLFRPTGIVCDSVNRRLIICDKDNNRIVFLSLDGHFISAFGRRGHQNGEFDYPWDVDVSSSGDLIAVTDSRNHRIQMFDRFGNYLRKFSIFETNPFEYKLQLDYPRGITFDLEGKNLFVTDFNSHNVLRLNVELTESRRLIPPGKLCRPQGITVDQIGNLLVCDSRRNCIRVINHDGDLLSTVERIGKMHLVVPSDVTIMRGGEVAAFDFFGKIRIF